MLKNLLKTFGMTKEEALARGICISCKKTVYDMIRLGPILRDALFRTESGKKEWYISGVCEVCYDDFFKDEED